MQTKTKILNAALDIYSKEGFVCVDNENRKDIAYVGDDVLSEPEEAATDSMHPYGPAFNYILRENLIDLDLLAKAAGIDRSLLKLICQGEVRISTANAVLLANALPEALEVTAYSLYNAQCQQELAMLEPDKTQ